MPSNETGIVEASVGAGFHAYPRLAEIRNVKRAGTEACPYEWFVRFMMAPKRIRQPRADTEVVSYAEIFGVSTYGYGCPTSHRYLWLSECLRFTLLRF